MPSEPSGKERTVKAGTFLDDPRGRWLVRAWCPLVYGELPGEAGTWKALDFPSMSLCRLLPLPLLCGIPESLKEVGLGSTGVWMSHQP